MTTNNTIKNNNIKHPFEFLDNTQKELLQELIKEKLKQLNHDDDVLLEYTTVLLSNRKVQTVMKEDLKPFLGANTDTLVDWIWGNMEDIRSGILNSPHRERDPERDSREKEKEKDREIRGKERHRNFRENASPDHKKPSGGSRLLLTAVKSLQESKRNEKFRNNTELPETNPKSDNHKKRDVSRVISERKKTDEDPKRWRDNSSLPNIVEERVDLKRSRSENETIVVANKKAKVFMTPEAKSKIEVPREVESEGVTFTVTIGAEKAKSTREDQIIDQKSHPQIIYKPNRIYPVARYPHYMKLQKQIYNRPPRVRNGRFKNMSLVLDKTNNFNPKIPKAETPDTPLKTLIDQKPTTVLPIPPKKLPQNFPKQKCSASSAPVNYLASKLSLDSELPDITVTRGGNMVWRSHEVKVEK